MFDMTRIEDRFVVRGTLGGREVTMMLDTGARMSALVPAVAPEGELVGHVACAGAGGQPGSTFEVRRVQDVVFGELEVSDTKLILRDLGPLEQLGIQGILGRDIFLQKNVTLDFDEDRATAFDGTLEEGVPFHEHHGGIYFDARINGNSVEYMIFDTGASFLSLDAKQARKLGLPEHEDRETHVDVQDSEGNDLGNRTLLVAQFDLGPIHHENLVAASYSLEKIAALKQLPAYGGILGKTVFDGFRFTFDLDSRLCRIDV